ncbi:hypothetical protein KKG83_06605 [Candidatus Micrarchaeota archaeon]|nr:hypothetical protein [Candidatus Micrarchaeota archaeon]MBU2477114.1 hypothetical protein [Candidatus Micrarchaeota archaeon]
MRKPVRKFIKWNSSKARRKRIEEVGRLIASKLGLEHENLKKTPKAMSKEGIKPYRIFVNPIFRSAEQFLELGKTEKATFLFVGQGMRPLFEAVRGLNEIRSTFGRRKLKYFVTPSNRNNNITNPSVEILKEELIRRKAVPKEAATVYIIDTSRSNKTHERMTIGALPL